MNNYVVYHLHSDLSLLDSATKFQRYLDKAVEYGMKALGFSEHGCVFNWINKKKEIEARGMKYIHAMEAYVTESLDDKVRDNYHMMFVARNLEGVKELNKMSSKAFYKNDGHFYYDARFTIEEVMATSDNIMITTSCLGGILAKSHRNGNHMLFNRFIQWAAANNHRVFLEIQYHNYHEQIEYNHILYGLSQQYGFKLIAGTDTHSLDQRYAMGRRILMQAKRINFKDEDKFDLTFKSYDGLIEMFEKQTLLMPSDAKFVINDETGETLHDWKERNSHMFLPQEVVMKAIDFTNKMANMVEEFKLDKSPKYPKMYDNPVAVFQSKINDGIKRRGINKFPKEKRQQYYKVVDEEFEVYKKVDAIDYMLFQEDVTTWAQANGIHQGYGRGSVNGSLIAYILGITEMDSIKHNLNFFRFMNPERISLADIDVDFPPSRREEVIDYVASKEGIYFSEIITFNTIADKGAIREVGRALKMDLGIIDEIAKGYEDKPSYYRDQYPQLFEYVDILKGVNVSVGSHPSGYVVSPIPLDENIGTFFTADSKYPVSQVNMKELDSNNYVKLDILGLLNDELINLTCELAGIERLTPDNMDTFDEDVWASMRESTLGVFQWESDSAFAYYKELFKPETIVKIREQNPNFNYIDLFSIGNGAIRPSGDSYRSDLANGVFKENGHPALNDFLKDTQGYLVYQEQIMNWLVQFCGFSMAQSDSVRRGIAKKENTQQFLVPIEKGFLKTMKEQYNTDEEKAKEILASFLKVIDDASLYGFSLNHSQPYSFIGYANAYLRYHYPLEFLTALLNLKDDKKVKTALIVEYAKTRGIKLSAIKFGKSRAVYSFSKEENTIFKGLNSIKYLNATIAEELYELGKRDYKTFVDVLVDVANETKANAKQIEILIRLNFFSAFGEMGKLLAIVEEFNSGTNRYNKNHKEDTKLKRLPLLRQFEQLAPNVKLEMIDVIMFEKEHLGYIETKFEKVSEEYAIVLAVDKKYTPKLTLYVFRTGEEVQVKVQKKKFYDAKDNDNLLVGDIIKIKEVLYKNKVKMIGGIFVEQEEKEPFLEALQLIKRPKTNEIKGSIEDE